MQKLFKMTDFVKFGDLATEVRGKWFEAGRSISYNLHVHPAKTQSACAVDQSLRCPHRDALDPLLRTAQ